MEAATLRLYHIPRSAWRPSERVEFLPGEERGFIAVPYPAVAERSDYVWTFDDPAGAFKVLDLFEGSFVQIRAAGDAPIGAKATLKVRSVCEHGYGLDSQVVELVIASNAPEPLTDETA